MAQVKSVKKHPVINSPGISTSQYNKFVICYEQDSQKLSFNSEIRLHLDFHQNIM